MGQFIISYLAPVAGFIVAILLFITYVVSRKYNALSRLQSSILLAVAIVLVIYFGTSLYLGFTPNETPPIYQSKQQIDQESTVQAATNELTLSGVMAEAKVSFVDKVWNYQVNGKPVYSIVKYEYTVNSQQYSGSEQLKSDDVIRENIKVGDTLTIRYAPNNPKTSEIVGKPADRQLTIEEYNALKTEGKDGYGKVISIKEHGENVALSWEFEANGKYYSGWTDVPLEYIQTMGITVGSMVSVRYLPQGSENALVMQEKVYSKSTEEKLAKEGKRAYATVSELNSIGNGYYELSWIYSSSKRRYVGTVNDIMQAYIDKYSVEKGSKVPIVYLPNSTASALLD